MYGGSQQLMWWLSSYLSERKRFVLFKGKQTEQFETTTGVPQRSILEPLYFLCSRTTCSLSTKTICNVGMYADDSTISVCDKSVQEIEMKLNNDLPEISTWLDKNWMVINVEETKIMIVTTRQKWQHVDRTEINICKGDKLQMVESERLLGLQVDNFLYWNVHVQKTHNSIFGIFALLGTIITSHIKQGKRSTTATFYNILTPAPDYVAMQTHQSAFTN